MKVYRAKLKSECGLLYNRGFEQEAEAQKRDGESDDAREGRCWRMRAHANEDGFAVIQGIFFKNSIHEAARYRSDKVPGSRGKLFTKIFEASVTVYDPIVTAVKVENLKGITMYVPSDGKHGSGKRVWKTFPVLEKWEGSIDIIVMDPRITREVLFNTLATAGAFIGVGGRRPANRGDFGRFNVLELEEVQQPEPLAA